MVTVSATPMKWGHGSQAFLIRMYVSSMPSCFSQQVYFPDKGEGGGIPREVLRILRHLAQSDHTKKNLEIACSVTTAMKWRILKRRCPE